jgi:fatty-acyl-CoA synthase
MTILDGLKNSAAAAPGKIASITPSARYTYAQLDERVNRLTHALAGLGIERGERVAILALNTHRYLELYYGVPQLGAVVVPLNFRITPAEVLYIIEHSEAVAVCVDDALAPMIDALRPRLTGVKQFLSIGGQKREGYHDYEELLAGAAAASVPAAGITEDDLLGLFYTSGTSVGSKRAM